MASDSARSVSRRSLFKLIGAVAGSTVMYHAMSELGFAGESGYSGPIKLKGDPKGASVLILGAGVAGMSAALELRNAGYQVQVLEYNDRPGGRNWSLYGGDTYTELGGATQHVEFSDGLYLNPGPWRIPYHHRALIDYCKRLNVVLEPFTQVNYNAYVHSATAFGGRPQRYREVQADFNGHVAELLAKATNQRHLDHAVTGEDREILVQAMREWGALDSNYEYKKGLISGDRRGFSSDPGGGLTSVPTPSEPMAMQDLLHSRLWAAITAGHGYEFQSSIFQPAGGMGMIGKAFGRALDGLIQYNAKVTEIKQDANGVSVAYHDTKAQGPIRTATAQWCICTIPASILSQIPMTVGAPMKSAIDALYYDSAIKVGLQFKRRFWEQDESIYGGITFTDLPNAMIGYPNSRYFDDGPGVLLGAYTFGANSFQYAALSPEDRIKKTVEYGSQIHSQYREEFQHGVAVAWHRVPFTLGCAGHWTDDLRARHYDNLCAIDGRIVLAGEHASRLPAWQEGALLSSLDAIRRLHAKVCSSMIVKISTSAWITASATLVLVVFAAAAGVAQEIYAGGYHQQTGEALYRGLCQGCHMSDAKGATGAGTYPALANNARLVAEIYPITVVVHGQRAMPSFGADLSDEQIANVLNYVRTHFGNRYKDVITPAAVKASRD